MKPRMSDPRTTGTDPKTRGGRRIPPLVWIIVAVLVGWLVIAFLVTIIFFRETRHNDINA